MTKRSSSKPSKNSSQKMNPLARPKPKIRAPLTNFDGTVITSHWYPGQATTLVNVGATLMPIDLSNTNSGVAPVQLFSAALNVQPIVSNYQEYYYRKLQIKWLSATAPGVADAGSRITVAYFSNPEVINNLIAAASATVIAAVKTSRSAKSWNAWENFTYNVPLTRRRKFFDQNTNIAYSADTIDRSVQGLVCVVYESISASATLGQVNIVSDIVLKTMATGVTT